MKIYERRTMVEGRMTADDYFDRRIVANRPHPQLVKQKFDELWADWRQTMDDRLAERLAERLVCSVTGMIINAAGALYRRVNMAFDDAVQYGFIGAFRALDKYDPARGARFSTYAGWWIRQEIIRGGCEYREIRLPDDKMNMLRKFLSVRFSLFNENGREPTEDELSAKLGWQVERVRRTGEFARQQPFSLEALPSADLAFSLGGGTSIKRNIVLERVLEANVFARLQQFAQQLRVHERLVFVARVLPRIFNDKPKILEELGKELGVSRQRVQQIEVSVRAKLRSYWRR